MGRVTSFRVGIIKARFCKALLAQFKDDIDREGTVSFRSQWDVASLARLICTLGLQDEQNAEFWNSYVNGGHIGPEFTAKAVEMINVTARDGPLLIFCQLGHLTATAIPLGQSGLELKDIEKVWELQRKLIEDKRLSLNRASHIVWEALGQRREQVNDLCYKNTGRDREILHRLLRMIDDVLNLRYPGPEGVSQSEVVEEQSPQTPVAVNSASYPWGSRRGISNRSGFAPKPIAVSIGPSSCTQSSEGGFERESFIKFLELLLTLSQSFLRITFYVARNGPMVCRSLHKSYLKATSRPPVAFHLRTSKSKPPLVSGSSIVPSILPRSQFRL